MTSNQTVRILIVDDHDVVRLGLRSLLDGRGRYRVVGEATTMATAIDVASVENPDVVIMDIRLPDGSGIEACREIRARKPTIRVLMLTSFADDEAIFSAIMAGAAGYVLKQIRGQALLDAIDAVADGGSLLDPLVTQKVLERLRNASDKVARPRPDSLTEQEDRVLKLVAEGQTNREIAEALFLSEGTVKNYVSNILSKLNYHRRSQLVAHVARGKQRASDSDG